MIGKEDTAVFFDRSALISEEAESIKEVKMGILEAFDNTSKPIIMPSSFLKAGKLGEKCIVTFSVSVYERVLQEYRTEKVAESGTANGRIDILRLTDYDVLFYMSPIGSAVAATFMQEVQYLTGVTSFIFFGSCGVLNKQYSDKIIIPTEAYREEGLSYHYAEAADYIELPGCKQVKAVFENDGIDFIIGKTWTTDAIFMETETKAQNRRMDGCVCVEMEASGLQAMSNYLGTDLYIFFFAGDILGKKWESGNLGGFKEKKKQISSFEMALKVAESVNHS